MVREAAKEKMLRLLTGKEEGFTLLEITVCLLLLGIAAALIIPSFNSLLMSISEETTSRKVVSLFNQVRGRAIEAGEIQEIVIKENKFIYETGEGEEFSLEEEIEDISLREAEEDKISFFPDGTSTGGEVVVTTKQDQQFKVVVDPVSGKSRVED